VPYKVLIGLSYPPDKRAEAGDIVDDLPSKSIKWLLDNGHIEEISGSVPKPNPASMPLPEPEIIEKDGE
jgi:hypothetical protein